MSKEICCFNCGQKFYPHGGQMFCCKGCRLDYYERMKPESNRFLKKIESVKFYNEVYIKEKKYGGKLHFDFMQCTKCFSKYALEMNNMFPYKKTTCPFCGAKSKYSAGLSYYKVEEVKR